LTRCMQLLRKPERVGGCGGHCRSPWFFFHWQLWSRPSPAPIISSHQHASVAAAMTLVTHAGDSSLSCTTAAFCYEQRLRDHAHTPRSPA
jgi:hypothetical protein